jgi:hypothetical protein
LWRCEGADLLGYPHKPHLFELAEPIYAPSLYQPGICFKLSPINPRSRVRNYQRLFETFQGISNATRKFYLHLPAQDFYTEVELINEDNYRFFMAKPWKAICDYVYCYKKDWKNIHPLLFSLRIDREDLVRPTDEEIEILDEYYHQRRLSIFLKGIKKDLSNKNK